MGRLAQAVAERKSVDIGAFWDSIVSYGSLSKAGTNVSLDNAFKVAVLFAGIRVIAQGVAQVPFKLLRETKKDGLRDIQPAKDHYLYDLLATQPNDWTTSFEFRETLVMHAALGNAYCYKNVSRGKIFELIPLKPGCVRKIQAPDWSITYEVTGQNGAQMNFPAEAIWHVRGPSWDGCLGLDVLNLARESLGLALATEESHARLHANGVRPSGTYSVEGTLNPEQHKQLRKFIAESNTGANAGSPMILDRGATWLSQAMTGVDAQHLETRKYQIEEVCRFLGLMPIMVGYSDKTATFASADAFFAAHVKHTLSPWYTRIEQSADVNLLSKQDRANGLYFNFNAAGLLRGSDKDRSDYYAKALGSGGGPAWMMQDEVRALEELNPLGGEAGKLPPRSGTPAPVPTEPVKSLRMDDLEQKVAAIARQPLHITLNQEPIEVHPSPVTVNMAPPPAVTVNSAPVTVNVPPAPEVKAAPPPNVQVDVHVPPGPAPIVQNTVNVPDQPAPNVTFEATLPPLDITVKLPARKTHSETDVKRDDLGNIIKSTTDSTESDA